MGMGTTEPRPGLRVGFEDARLRLARVTLESADALERVAAQAATICADALSVERVGVWIFQPGGEQLLCKQLFTRSTRMSTSGDILPTRAFPTYCRALTERRAIVADDARTHPDTCELAPSYLEPLGIGAMLDAPVFRGGQVYGVICHEHVGPARAWTQAEVEFASAVAEVMAAACEQAERLRLEEQLRAQAMLLTELRRLEQLRTVVMAVAHDFGNVLNGVVAATVKLDRAGQVEAARTIQACTDMGVRLLGELTQFGRPRSSRESDETVAIGPVIEALSRPLEMLVRDRAVLAVDVVGGDACVPLREVELEQVLLNLCVNARDAIPLRGRIALRTSATPSEVAIEVEDDGVGMSEAVREQIFDAYFTTKSRGTGLGLAIVRDLVARAHGSIEVASELGRGTRFRVVMPRA